MWLERPTEQSPGEPEADQAGDEMMENFEVISAALVADGDPAEAGGPVWHALDHPAASTEPLADPIPAPRSSLGQHLPGNAGLGREQGARERGAARHQRAAALRA
jgi:hypothetical protein